MLPGASCGGLPHPLPHSCLSEPRGSVVAFGVAQVEEAFDAAGGGFPGDDLRVACDVLKTENPAIEIPLETILAGRP